MSEKKFRGKLCMVCDTQATRFLEGYAYCDFHDRSTKPRLPSMGADSLVFRVASPQATRAEPSQVYLRGELRARFDAFIAGLIPEAQNVMWDIIRERLSAAQPAAGTTPTRNSEVLADFAKYCEAHPAQRFWQALRNWSEYHFVEVRNPGKQHLDTFDWEGRRHDK